MACDISVTYAGVLCGFRITPRPLARSEAVGRAPHPLSSSIQHVRVDHRCLDVLVAKKLLNRPYVVAPFEQMGRKGAPEGVRSGTRRLPRVLVRDSMYWFVHRCQGRSRFPSMSNTPLQGVAPSVPPHSNVPCKNHPPAARSRKSQ